METLTATRPAPTSAPSASDVATDVAALRTLYAWRDAEVGAFLVEHPFLAPLLQAAPAQIRRHFPRTALRLQVRHDPEAIGRAQLFLYIETALEPEAALDRLDALRQTWWLEQARQAQGKLGLALAYL